MASAPWTSNNKVGLLLTVLLGLINIWQLTNPTPAGKVGPPFAVLVADALLGVAMVAAATFAWLKVSRNAARVATAANILAALTALPAFVVDLPSRDKLAVAIYLIAAVVAAVITLSKPDAPTSTT